ncbi:hypothetical protein [Streptomyces sp. NPDC060010]|uniref:hypothetical protein n=1 Tax=Streptomyces sp. NPDC060010 TaxID=3347036 RepID=UPI00369C3B16
MPDSHKPEKLEKPDQASSFIDLLRNASAVNKGIEIIPDVLRVGLDAWKTKRDGTFFEQNAYMAALHEQAARAAHHRDLESDWHRARITVRLQAETARQAQHRAHSPFNLPPEDIHDYLYRETGGGRVPALLIAPFFQDDLGRDDNDKGPSRFLLALRRTWDRMPWQDDLVPVAGAIGRPLRNLDLDVRIIREALHDLPVVLAYGEVQAGRRVLLELCAWNILGEAAGGSAIRLSVPGLTLPHPEDGSDRVPTEAALAFEDELGTFCGVLIGVLCDWFHLTHRGRTPQLHRLLPERMETARRVVASAAAPLFALAVEYDLMDPVTAYVGQAELYAETGQTERARDIGDTALTALRAEPTLAYAHPELLVRLGRVFEAIGDAGTGRKLWAWYVEMVWR